MTKSNTETRPKATDRAYPSETRAWLAVLVLMVVYIFSYIDRTILTLLVGPIRHDLHISDTQISLLHGLAFALFYSVLGLPIGRLVDSRNRIGIISVGVFVWSVMTAACGLTRSFAQLFLVRIGVGAGEAALSPSAYSIITDYFPPARLSRALSIYVMASYLGMALAYIIGGGVITVLQSVAPLHVPLVGDLGGWRIAFLLVGLPGAVLSLLVWIVREPPRHGTLRDAAETVRAIPLREAAGYLVLNWRTYSAIFVGFGFLAMLINGMALWTPTYLVRVHGWTVGQAGTVYGIMIGIFGSGGLIAGGWLSDRVQQRGRRDACIFVAAVGSACAVIPTILTPLMPSSTGVLLMMAPAVFFGSFPFGLAVSALQQITPNQLRGQVSAIYLFFSTLLGIGCGPVLIGMTTDYVFHNDAKLGFSMAIVGGVSAVAATLILFAGCRPYAASFERAASANLG